MVIKTIIFSIIIVILCLLGLGIGLIITGKSKLRKRCGQLPDDGSCKKGKCEICSPPKKDKSDFSKK